MRTFFRKNKKNNEQGFVALFAVLVSSILLLMALSISGVAYKEQLLSVNAKSSQYSFTAADTGLECALYWDVKQAVFSTGANPSLTCGGMPPQPVVNISTPTFFVYTLPVNAMVNTTTVPGCAVFSINKDYNINNPDGTVTNATKIEARGYNVDCTNIEYGIGGIGDLHFTNGAGARAVERLLGATYAN